MKSIIPLVVVNNEPRIDSRIAAEELGIQHKSFLETVRTYQCEMEVLGVLPFEIAKPPHGSVGGRPETYVMLNESQATFAMTLSRNTPQVVQFKLRLVQAFSQIRQELTPQKKPRVYITSHRGEITHEQEKELVYTYVLHIWYRYDEAATTSRVSYFVKRLSVGEIMLLANELVVEGRLETFTTPHTRKYRPNEYMRRNVLGRGASYKYEQ